MSKSKKGNWTLDLEAAVFVLLVVGTSLVASLIPAQQLLAAEGLHPDSAEFLQKKNEMGASFTISPRVVKNVERLVERYPEQSGAGKYQRSGHQHTTFIVAMAAGLGRQKSYELAYYSQFPDDEIKFSATLAFFYLFTPSYRHQIMATLHSLHGGGQEAVFKRRIDLKDLIRDGIENNSLKSYQIGLMIHAFADSYAHTEMQDGQLRAFDYAWGHLFHGHKPDIIVYDPEKYMDYTCELFKALSLKKSCQPALQELSNLIKGLETGRNAELPKFDKYVVRQLGFEQKIYDDYAGKWEGTVTKQDVVDTIDIIESKISGQTN